MYWTFYKSTITINLGFSGIVGLVALSITAFAICMVTFGLFLSLLYKETIHSQEYYFYFNRGISKIKLFIFCIVVNCLLSIFLLTCSHLCHIFLK